MPKRTDIHKIMITASGPIVIGTACKVLRSERLPLGSGLPTATQACVQRGFGG